MKKYLAIIMMVVVGLTLTGCGDKAANKGGQSVSGGESSDRAILVVSFGTSYNDSRDKTIGEIENAIKAEFRDYDVRRAFTSQIIIDKLKERDGLEIDNVGEALERAVSDGIKTLIVQPTHLMSGYEYTDLKDELEAYRDKFDTVKLAEPLLSDDDDFEAVANILVEETSQYADGNTAVCFMGHGTEADSNGVYSKLQKVLSDGGNKDYYIGTVDAEPTLEDVMKSVGEGNYKKVVLEPLMVVSGDHANNDMAGDEEDSWKSQFEAADYEVECILKGLGEFKGIQDIYIAHTKAAIEG
ncbi:MAG: sirohydrochlorin cobaltochelatase [Firmicutes bacterium]|nr:sirohydrochlorin cobaltochelatase [Bacillota bacterium]